MDDDGGFRSDDPSTSKRAARSIKVGPLMRKILIDMQYAKHPLNGFEITERLNIPNTHTIVPRLAPLRRLGLIVQQGERPGPPPKRCAQIAYVITDRGLDLLAGKFDPPPPPVPPKPALPDDIAVMNNDTIIQELRHGAMRDPVRRAALWRRLDELNRSK